MILSPSELQAFLLSKTVQTSGPLNTDCLIWTKAKSHGYGHSGQPDMPNTKLVHRALWILKNGPITDGRVLDHLCVNPSCCNTDHLELVTFGENTLRGIDHRYGPGSRDFCKKGHPFSGENLRIVRRQKKPWQNEFPTRICRTCRRDIGRRYLARKKQESR